MKKRLGIALAVIVITAIPALIMLVVTYVATGALQPFATWASLPAVAGMAATLLGGRRFAVIAAIATGMIAPLSVVAGLSAVAGAALMGLMAMTVGRLSRFGLHKSALLYPVIMSWALIDPPTWAGQSSVDRLDQTYLLWMAATFFVGAVFPAIVLPRLIRDRPTPALSPSPRREATTYTVMITALVTVSTFLVLANPKWYGGAFLIAAILIMAPLGEAQTLRPTLLRILGTLVGTVLLVGVVSQIQSLAVVYLVGLLFIVMALMARFGAHGWLYYVFMMPATAGLNATTLAQVGQLGEQRLIDNIVGGILVLLASAAAILYSHWADRHGHASDDDPETQSLLDPTESIPAST